MKCRPLVQAISGREDVNATDGEEDDNAADGEEDNSAADASNDGETNSGQEEPNFKTLMCHGVLASHGRPAVCHGAECWALIVKQAPNGNKLHSQSCPSFCGWRCQGAAFIFWLDWLSDTTHVCTRRSVGTHLCIMRTGNPTMMLCSMEKRHWIQFACGLRGIY